ncbi:androglobin [Nothobranchius furzeri]|uniref:Androglobin n=1 Tax=Nothobranchius furzeri TaxID=105023 RepID=A0A9D3C3X9_NOTFU|nr:androglobin [Nothobranchius furzeri]
MFFHGFKPTPTTVLCSVFVLLEGNEDSNQSGTRRDSQPVRSEDQDAAGLQAEAKRQILNVKQPGTLENLRASKILSDIWLNSQSDAEKHAVSLLRCFVNMAANKVELCPGLKEASTRIAFADYALSPQQTASSWLWSSDRCSFFLKRCC